jgi:hypothetical protein
MTYIIAEPSIDIKDRSCVDVCPTRLHPGSRRQIGAALRPDGAWMKGDAENVKPESRPLNAPRPVSSGSFSLRTDATSARVPPSNHLHVLTSAR